MQKHRLLIIMVAVVFVLGACFLPLPVKKNLEVKGYEMSEDGTVMEEVAIEVDCWEWNFLFLKDKLTGKVVVSSASGNINLKLTYGSKMHDGSLQASASGYQSGTDSEEGKYLQFVSIDIDQDGTMIAIRTGTGEQERRFVGAKDSTLTAENIWSYFYGNP